jgi:NitT/TauT family transport system substrate-binding protein
MNYPRRQFLRHASALTAASLFGMSHRAAAEPAPEIKTLRLAEALVACQAPLHVAEELLRAEGFSNIEYLPGKTDTGVRMVAKGTADFAQWDVGATFPLLDQSASLSVLAGVHAGCTELFVHEHIRTIKDLKGKKMAVSALGNGDHVFASSILAYVGVNPKDVDWVTGAELTDTKKLFIDRRADAIIAFEPEPHDLRAQNVGRSILNTRLDRPWSHYFCCVLVGNRDFVRKYPVATKRTLRALLKAADVCAQEPQRVARFMADRGYEKRYEIGLEIIKNLPYARWRDGNPEDTLRFHALRLHEVGMIKSTPEKLIARGADWRFLNELKRELKV